MVHEEPETAEPWVQPPEHSIVARLRLPMPMSGLEILSDWLERAYGPGLRMIQPLDEPWLLVFRPSLGYGLDARAGRRHGDPAPTMVEPSPRQT